MTEEKLYSLQQMVDEIDFRVDEEFKITTGFEVSRFVLESLAHYYSMGLMGEPKRKSTIPPHIKYVRTNGGLHGRDIGIYFYFFNAFKVKEEEYSMWIAEDSYHWNFAYCDTSPKVTEAISLAATWFKFESLKSYLIRRVQEEMAKEKIKKISESKLNVALRKLTKEFWIEQKKMEEASKKSFEQALEQMMKRLPEEQREQLAEGFMGKEEELERRKFIEEIEERKKKSGF